MIQKPFETYGFKLYFKTMADNTLRSGSSSLSSGSFHYFVPIMLNLELLFFSHGSLIVEGMCLVHFKSSWGPDDSSPLP